MVYVSAVVKRLKLSYTCTHHVPLMIDELIGKLTSVVGYGVPTQLPLLQVSLAVQPSMSSQAMLLLTR